VREAMDHKTIDTACASSCSAAWLVASDKACTRSPTCWCCHSSCKVSALVLVLYATHEFEDTEDVWE
jgi:hypothetical protein